MSNARCIKCARIRDKKYMVQAVFPGFVTALNEPVDVWKCAANESCKQARKEARNDYANGHTYDRT